MEDLSDGEFDESGLRMKKTKLLKRAANTTLSDIQQELRVASHQVRTFGKKLSKNFSLLNRQL